MPALPDVDDLRLVLAVHETGSLGAAARRLQIAQPSASTRLSRLERQLGVALFTRSTRGAAATAAGAEMARQAGHILGHLERVYNEVRAVSETPTLTIGTFHSAADSVFPILDQHLGADRLIQAVDHGPTLIDWVAEGMLDAAVVAVADQVALPHGAVVHPIGSDEVVVLVPAGAAGPGRGRQPLRGLRMPVATYDLRRDDLVERLTALGATPRFGATISTTLRMARQAGECAVVPRSAASVDLRDGDRIVALPFSWRLTLSLVTRPDAGRDVLGTVAALRRGLNLKASP